jgi:hypothetical protein
MYNGLEEMQKDVDQWMELYNNERAHSGRYCFGKTPMKTFIDSKELAKAKDVNNLFGQINNFALSDQAEVSTAEEQLTRNSLNDGNDKAVEKNPTTFNQKSFLSQMP